MTHLSTEAAAPVAAKRKRTSFREVRQRLLSLMPGTRAFKRAVKRQIAVSMKEWRVKIRALIREMLDLDPGLLDERAERNIQRTLVRYQQQLSPYRSISRVLENSYATLAVLSLFMLLLGWLGSYRLARLLGYQGAGTASLFVWEVLSTSLLILWLLTKLQRLLESLHLRGNADTLTTLSLYTLTALTAGFIAYRMLVAREAHTDDMGYFVLLIGLSYLPIFLLWVYGLAAVLAIFQSFLDHRNRTLFPEAQFADCLMEARIKVKQWDRPESRLQILNLLETGAACLEKPLRRQMASGDAGTDAWFVEMTQEIALGLRGLKKWVLLPRTDTPEHLVRRLLVTLRDAARGDWDSIYREKPELLSRPKRAELFAASALRAGRQVLAAGLPLLILWLLLRLGVALPEAVVNYLTLAGIYWGAISILHWIDPEVKSKPDLLSIIQSLKG